MTDSTGPERCRHFVFSSPGPNRLQMISENERSTFCGQWLCQYIFCIALCMMGISFVLLYSPDFLQNQRYQ